MCSHSHLLRCALTYTNQLIAMLSITSFINKHHTITRIYWRLKLKNKYIILENQQSSKRTVWLLVFGIILIGSNLRAPLTSVGSLIPFIRDDLALTNAIAGSITTLPLIAFALLSPLYQNWQIVLAWNGRFFFPCLF